MTTTNIPATVSDLLASDLRTHYLSAVPAGCITEALRIRLRDTEGEPPLPRIEIIPGEPRRFPQMDGTSRVPINFILLHSKDHPDLETVHKTQSARLDDWWRALRLDLRPGPFLNLYLHDWLTLQPITGYREESRERFTALRAEAIVTLSQPA
jgi:hypothetical protein